MLTTQLPHIPGPNLKLFLQFCGNSDCSCPFFMKQKLYQNRPKWQSHTNLFRRLLNRLQPIWCCIDSCSISNSCSLHLKGIFELVRDLQGLCLSNLENKISQCIFSESLLRFPIRFCTGKKEQNLMIENQNDYFWP